MVGVKVRTIIECRDYNKRIDVTHVDGVVGLMRDVKADKAIIVSRKGFSKAAQSKADRFSIGLCTMNDPKTELARIGLTVPVIATSLVITGFRFYLAKTGHPKGDFYTRDLIRFNDRDVFDEAAELLSKGKLSFPINDKAVIPFTPAGSLVDCYIRDVDGKKVTFGTVENFALEVETEFYAGEVDALALQHSLGYTLDNKVCVFLEAEKLTQFESHLVRFKSYVDIPKGQGAVRLALSKVKKGARLQSMSYWLEEGATRGQVKLLDEGDEIFTFV